MKKQPYVIVRTRDAGVHAGTLVKRTGGEVELKNSRRIWYWKGACSLSELAMSGPKFPQDCRFAVVLPAITIIGVCEVIPCSAEGQKAIKAVPEWKA